MGQGIEAAQGCPAEEFRLLALDRLVPLLEVLLLEVPLLLDVPLLDPPLLEVPLLVEPWEEVLLLEALLEALGAGM